MTQTYGYAVLRPETYVVIHEPDGLSAADIGLLALVLIANVQNRIEDLLVVALGCGLFILALGFAGVPPEVVGQLGPIFGLGAFIAWSALGMRRDGF